MSNEIPKQQLIDMSLEIKGIRHIEIEKRGMERMRWITQIIDSLSTEQMYAATALARIDAFAVRYNCLCDEMSKISEYTTNKSIDAILTALQDTITTLPSRIGHSGRQTIPNKELDNIEKEFLKAVRDCVDGCRYGVEFLTKRTRIIKQPDIFKFELYKTTLETVPRRMNKIYDKVNRLRQLCHKIIGDL